MEKIPTFLKCLLNPREPPPHHLLRFMTEKFTVSEEQIRSWEHDVLLGMCPFLNTPPKNKSEKGHGSSFRWCFIRKQTYDRQNIPGSNIEQIKWKHFHLLITSISSSDWLINKNVIKEHAEFHTEAGEHVELHIDAGECVEHTDRNPSSGWNDEKVMIPAVPPPDCRWTQDLILRAHTDNTTFITESIQFQKFFCFMLIVDVLLLLLWDQRFSLEKHEYTSSSHDHVLSLSLRPLSNDNRPSPRHRLVFTLFHWHPPETHQTST